jgi:hypothetical protein
MSAYALASVGLQREYLLQAVSDSTSVVLQLLVPRILGRIATSGCQPDKSVCQFNGLDAERARCGYLAHHPSGTAL